MFYVEVIRNLAEFVIYGEKILKKKHGGPSYFDVLCERNTLERFQYILGLNNRFINMQLIQTSSIFLYNISQQTKKCKLLITSPACSLHTEPPLLAQADNLPLQLLR